MGRFWVSLTALGLCFGLAVGNGRVLDRLTGEMTDLLVQAQVLAEQEAWDRATALTEEAMELWQASEDYLYVVLRHAETDAVARQFRQVRELLQWGEEAEYTSANASLVEDIRRLSEMDAFTLKNLL